MKLPAFAAFLLMSLAAGVEEVSAAPPSISSLSPRGAQRGKKLVLVVEGANLDASAELLVALPSPRRLLQSDPYKPAPNRVAFELLVNETDAPGPYPLRVRTAEGISNPVLFLVGAFPEAAETEPNDLPQAANPIQPPVTVNGSLGPQDRDTFRLKARAGEKITFEVEARRIGSAIDPSLHLLAENGREIGLSEDCPGLNVDCRLDFTFPADGEYLVQVHDAMFLPQQASFYRLKVGPIAYAEGVFPLGGRRGSEVLLTFEGGSLPAKVIQRVRLEVPDGASLLPVGLPPQYDTAGGLPFALRVGELPELYEEARPAPEAPLPIQAPSTVNGRLERPGEVDRYTLEVKPGQRWAFEVEAHPLGSLLDGVLAVANPQGARLALADDAGGPDPRLEFAVPENVTSVVLSLEDLLRRGGPGYGYRLTVKESRPGFLLSLATTTLNLPLGGSGILAVDVVRRGYNGPVRLGLVSPRPDFIVAGGRIPPGQPRGYLSISLPAAGKLEALDLVVRGVGEGDVEPAIARGTVFLATDRNLPVSPLPVLAVASAVAKPLPVAVHAPEGPVRLALGQSRSLKVQLPRGEGGEGALKLQGIFAPPGVTVAETAVAEKAAEGQVTLNAAPDAALGEGEAAVQVVGKAGGKDVAAASPIFAVVVVPPFAVDLAAVGLEGAPGSQAMLQGKVRREAPFAGPVELKVEGLPAGAQAAALTVPPDQESFQLPISLEKGMKPARLELKLTAQTKLGDPKSPKAFSAPPMAFSVTVQPRVRAVRAPGSAPSGRSVELARAGEFAGR